MSKTFNSSSSLCADLPAHIAFSQSLSADIRYNLSDSTAQSMTLKALCSMGAEDVDATVLSYGALLGSPSLRQAIVSFHRRLNNLTHDNNSELDETNVVTFCGAQEALAAIYQTVLQPGDEVVVITPCYPSLVSMAKQQGCVVKEVKLTQAQGYTLSIASFIPLVNKKTKLIVVNSPHNPSGRVVDSHFAGEILSLAKKFDCYLLADDVSQASNYHQLPLAHKYLSYDKAIIVSVLSKSFGLAGIRVGWAVCPDKQLMQALLANKCYGSICCSAVDLQLAEIALNNSEAILKRNNEIIGNNIDLFQGFIDRNSTLFSWQAPQAGILAMVKCHFTLPIEDFGRELAQQKGVLLLPISLFGFNGQYFRLGLGQLNLCQTLEQLQLFIDECDHFIKN